MTTKTPNQLNDHEGRDLDRVAAEWWVRVNRDEPSEADSAGFDAWLAASEVHRDAARRVEATWNELSVLGELQALTADLDKASINPPAPAAGPHRVSSFPRGPIAAMAACLALVFGIVAPRLMGPNAPTFAEQQRTDVGELGTMDLPDGSSIVLNSDSQIDVVYSDEARMMTMSQGEVFFTVAADPKRPFSVHTPNGTVTALGTAFSVRVENDTAELLVTEGRVELRSDAAKPGFSTDQSAVSARQVTAGEVASFGDTEPTIAMVDAHDVEKRLDWRDGVLVFRDESLGAVLDQLSRYSDVTIEVSDPELRDLPIVVYYRIGDIETMLEALELVGGIRVERVNGSLVRLSSHERL